MKYGKISDWSFAEKRNESFWMGKETSRSRQERDGNQEQVPQNDAKKIWKRELARSGNVSEKKPLEGLAEALCLQWHGRLMIVVPPSE